MPFLNGFELFAQIKKKDPHARACFVSAFEVHDEIKLHFPEQDRKCIIKKPVSIRELVEFINREIGPK
jgi:response regulator RpfG family c-di-GMP phosphodiesterase